MTTCHKRRVCCAPGHLFKVQTRYVPRSFNFSFILVPRTVQISGAVKMVQGDTKNGNFWETQQKIEEIQEKKVIDTNWTIITCLLRDSNPNYLCLKITYCRWRHPPRLHSFTATTNFKSSHSFVSHRVCCRLCRMRQSRILQSMQHTHRVTQKNGNFWNA